jgi:hypothetical protein
MEPGMKTMAVKVIDRLFLVVFGAAAPTDEEWSDYLALVERHGIDKTMQITWSEGGGPTPTQRRALENLLDGRAVPVAVLTSSLMVRVTVTALSLFNRRIKAFPPNGLGDAMFFLEIPGSRRETIQGALRDLRSQLGPRGVANEGVVAGRIPPHDLDAEAAVLSAILRSDQDLDTETAELSAILGARQPLDRALDLLKPEHFFSDANGRIYAAATALSVAGTPIDIGHLDEIGGPNYLAQLADATPAVADVGAHAQAVYEKWHLRALVETAETWSARAMEGAYEVDASQQVTTAGGEPPRGTVTFAQDDPLPGICLRCGVTDAARRPLRLVWVPPVAYLALPLGWPVCLLLILVAQKAAAVRLPFCERCHEVWRAGWFIRGGLIVGSQVALLVTLAITLNGALVWGILVGVASVVGLGLAWIRYYPPRRLRVQRIDGGRITMAGVNGEAVEAIEATLETTRSEGRRT